MKNNLSKLLKEAKDKGVSYGLLAMNLVAIVADDNILSDYIEEDKMAEAINRLEKERDRIWLELREDHSAEDATDILVGHAFKIRERRKMD